MKKITTITAIALLGFSVVSCSKSSSSDFIGQVQPKPPVHTIPEVNVISNWVTPNSFSVESDSRGNPFIKGTYSFDAATQINYNEDSHVELVYVRIPTYQRVPYQYKKLSFTVSVETSGVSGDVVVDNSLDPDGLKIYYKGAAFQFISRAVDLSVLDDWKFRYIVIPKSKYQSLNIDWNNLPAVAAVLNFSL